MMKTYSNPCIRCGTERIVLKTSHEKLGNSIIVTKEMVCPNEDCQSQVNADNKRQQDRYANLKLRSAQRQMARRVAMDAERVAHEKTA